MKTNNLLELTHLDGLFVVSKIELRILITYFPKLKLSTLHKKYSQQFNLSEKSTTLIVYVTFHVVIFVLAFSNNLP